MKYHNTPYRKSVIEEVQPEKIGRHPYRVMKSLFDRTFLHGKSVCDIGLYPEKEFASYIKRKDAEYIACNPIVEELRERKNNSIHFSLLRFVLSSLSENDRVLVLRNMLRVTKKRIFVLEYNWEILTSSSFQKQIQEFKHVHFSMLRCIEASIHLGGKLQEFTSDVLGHWPWHVASVERYKRTEGDYTDELIALCIVGADIAMYKDVELSEKFVSLREQLEKKPITFVPPAIEVVVIECD